MGLIAIGDIHGCAASLDALLNEIEPTEDDHLLFVGDYIDRGPGSRAVIDRLLELKEVHECTFLRGNHEALMLDYLDAGAFNLWRINGGITTMQSYLSEDGSEVVIPEEHEAFVRNTKLYYETDDFFFVHAGLKADLTIKENIDQFGEEVFLWERAHLDADSFAWEKPVVCGHTPHAEPINRDKLLMIDTGCVYHEQPDMGTLTAVRLPERSFIEVSYADGTPAVR
ncbi:MAG: metallophosphoesterase family protein [Longimonas sp.]|uniref:metallophosphoesterase family protein n=1 Tax=Longimonas sp. TaxID=2039626 RepID=UPI003351A095